MRRKEKEVEVNVRRGEGGGHRFAEYLRWEEVGLGSGFKAHAYRKGTSEHFFA